MKSSLRPHTKFTNSLLYQYRDTLRFAVARHELYTSEFYILYLAVNVQKHLQFFLGSKSTSPMVRYLR